VAAVLRYRHRYCRVYIYVAKQHHRLTDLLMTRCFIFHNLESCIVIYFQNVFLPTLKTSTATYETLGVL